MEGWKKTSEEALLAAAILGALPGAGVIGKGATVARTRFICSGPACKESKKSFL